MVCERPPAAFGGSPTEGENKINLPLVRGRRERSERGGRSHTILKAANLLSISSLHVRNTEVKSRRFLESTRSTSNVGMDICTDRQGGRVSTSSLLFD